MVPTCMHNIANLFLLKSSVFSLDPLFLFTFLFCLDPASITRGLQNITIRNETDSVIFSCTVIGIPHPNIIWARANSSQSPFTSTFLTNSSKTETSTTETLVQHNQIMINTTLEVRNLRKEDDEGYYRCTAINNVQNLIQANHDSTGHLIVQGLSIAMLTCLSLSLSSIIFCISSYFIASLTLLGLLSIAGDLPIT